MEVAEMMPIYFLYATKMEESAILLSIKNKNIVTITGDLWNHILSRTT